MARIRSIKPDFWTDSLMVQLPHFARLLYIALWNAADDFGFIQDEPERLAMELMPRESTEDVDAAIQLLIASERLEVFVDTEESHTFMRIPNWGKHQRVDRPTQSKIARESSRKLAIPSEVRRAVAKKYGCEPGGQKPAECFYCGAPGRVHWWTLADGRPSAWVVFPGLELDHFEAEFEGGVATVGNIVLACRRCNRSNRTQFWLDCMTNESSTGKINFSRVLASPRAGKEREKEKEMEQGGGTGKGGVGGKPGVTDGHAPPWWTERPPGTLVRRLAEALASPMKDCRPAYAPDEARCSDLARYLEGIDPGGTQVQDVLDAFAEAHSGQPRYAGGKPRSAQRLPYLDPYRALRSQWFGCREAEWKRLAKARSGYGADEFDVAGQLARIRASQGAAL